MLPQNRVKHAIWWTEYCENSQDVMYHVVEFSLISHHFDRHMIACSLFFRTDFVAVSYRLERYFGSFVKIFFKNGANFFFFFMECNWQSRGRCFFFSLFPCYAFFKSSWHATSVVLLYPRFWWWCCVNYCLSFLISFGLFQRTLSAQ